MLNVTISDVMDIIHPERKKDRKELPESNNTIFVNNTDQQNKKEIPVQQIEKEKSDL